MSAEKCKALYVLKFSAGAGRLHRRKGTGRSDSVLLGRVLILIGLAFILTVTLQSQALAPQTVVE